MNIIEKIWNKHLVIDNDKTSPSILGVDNIIMHDISLKVLEELLLENLKVKAPHKVLATIDHMCQTDNRRFEKNAKQFNEFEKIRQNTKKFNIKLHDFDSEHQGIAQIVATELGYCSPGKIIVATDSHIPTLGAFGLLAFSLGHTSLKSALVANAILIIKPKTMKVTFMGKLRPNVCAKDVILYFISQIGVDGAQGFIVEYAGEVIKNFSMEARMTICNMSTECGSVGAIIEPDDKTFDYLKRCGFSLEKAKNMEEFIKLKDISYDKEVVVDVSNIKPMITWGTNPSQAIAIDEPIPIADKFLDKEQYEKTIDYVRLVPSKHFLGTKIDWAFVGGCTNGRIEDLRVVASCLRGKKIASWVKMLVVPGSQQIYKQAEEEGIKDAITSAGATFGLPCCSMCVAMNGEFLSEGMRCVSTTNRNFVGRQGRGSITHLASPFVVALASLKGKITYFEKDE